MLVLPEAFLERMQGMLGEEYPAFLASFERERYHALRLNALKKGADGRSAAEIYGTAAICSMAAGDNEVSTTGQAAVFSDIAHLDKIPWAEDGYYYEACDQPGRHPFHAAGVYYIQEPSAMAPVELLSVQPGERVLDLCAAPGGKSTQIAAKLKRQGFLLCNEIHPVRAKILSENIERMGVVNACVTNETPARLSGAFPEYFDRVLVDAPCSGEGMFCKNDTACGEWSLENVRICAERQDGILDCAAEMLRAGGRLVYSTCTFAPEEDEGSVGRFLQRHPDFCLVPADIINAEKERLGLAGCDGMPAYAQGLCLDPAGCDGVPAYAQGPVPDMEGALRMMPHKVRGEGHFAAVLQKEGSLQAGFRRDAMGGSAKGISEKELGEFPQFCRENLRCGESAAFVDSCAPEMLAAVLGAALPETPAADGLSCAPRYIRFGGNLYLAPADMPGLRGLKVLRPGLHLGELKKNRFEPSHALALALSPQNAAHLWNLYADSPEAAAYLNGQTFHAEGEKGWYLVCVDGFGIGWGKLAGGVMKNHYPRGLRQSGGVRNV